jgi:aldose 1-epimerase
MAVRLIAMALVASAVMPAASAQAATARRAEFGKTADGRTVEAVTLANGHGMTIRVISWGAILQSVSVPDGNGKSADVVLGYSDMKGYIAAPNYFGASVGRYANRIKAGRFVIDGKRYQLAVNDKTNALHGGIHGFDKRLWRIVEVSGGPTAHVTLAYSSPDGEEGYPGKLDVTATYSLDERNQLTLEYRATTDKPTIVNLTNHSFFNLAGEAAGKTIYDTTLMIPADTTTPVDRSLIPVGSFKPVAGTPLDFRRPMAIGARIRDASNDQILFGQGYDENYVIARNVSAQPRLQARVVEPTTGRVMEILSNQPGVQLYTGNFLDGSAVGKSGLAYRQGDGLALEPQKFPDTPNQSVFGSARLDPGETYRNVIVYRFTTSAAR